MYTKEIKIILILYGQVVNESSQNEPITAALSCAPYGRSARAFILFQEKYLRFTINFQNRYWFDA